MKTIVKMALLLFLLIGMAGATNPVPTYRMGPYNGFYNPGPIKMGYGTVDNDLYVGGAVNVVGTVTDGATVSSGTIGHWAMMGANLPFTCLGTTNVFDWSNSSGAFTTSSGTVTSKGNFVVDGSKTTTTGTGAVTLKGTTTMDTAKTLIITDADALTVGGVIVPTEIAITVRYIATSVNETVFIADGAWKITGIKEAHSVVGGALNKAYIEKLTSTTAPGSGTTCMKAPSGGFDLTATINTVQSATLSDAASDYTLASGNRLGVVYGGTAGSRVGDITIFLKRV